MPITLRYYHSNAAPSQFFTLLDHMNPGVRASDLSLFTPLRSEKCPITLRYNHSNAVPSQLMDEQRTPILFAKP